MTIDVVTLIKDICHDGLILITGQMDWTYTSKNQD